MAQDFSSRSGRTSTGTWTSRTSTSGARSTACAGGLPAGARSNQYGEAGPAPRPPGPRHVVKIVLVDARAFFGIGEHPLNLSPERVQSQGVIEPARPTPIDIIRVGVRRPNDV